MILADIKRYLSQRGSASLADISMHFDTDPEAMRGMLEKWIQKGRISKHDSSTACGGCNICETENNVIYQWVDGASNSINGIGIKSDCSDG